MYIFKLVRYTPVHIYIYPGYPYVVLIMDLLLLKLRIIQHTSIAPNHSAAVLFNQPDLTSVVCLVQMLIQTFSVLFALTS